MSRIRFGFTPCRYGWFDVRRYWPTGTWRKGALFYITIWRFQIVLDFRGDWVADMKGGAPTGEKSS